MDSFVFLILHVRDSKLYQPSLNSWLCVAAPNTGLGSGEISGFLVPLKRHKGGHHSGCQVDNSGWNTCDNCFLFSILAAALCDFLFLSPKSYQIYLELPNKGTNTCPLGTCQVHCLSCFWRRGPASMEDASTQPIGGAYSPLLSSSVSSCRDSNDGLGQKFSGQWPWEDASLLTESTPLYPTITRNQREAITVPKPHRDFSVNTAISVSLPQTSFFLESSNALLRD